MGPVYSESLAEGGFVFIALCVLPSHHTAVGMPLIGRRRNDLIMTLPTCLT